MNIEYISKFWQETRGTSWCDEDLQEPIMLPQEITPPLSSCKGAPRDSSWSLCRGIVPHLELKHEIQGSSPVVTEISGFLYCFNSKIRPRLVLKHGTMLSSCVVKEASSFRGLLLSSGRNLVFLDVQQETDIPGCCEGILGVRSSGARGIRPYPELSGNSVSFRIAALN